MGIRMRPPHAFEWGGGGGVTSFKCTTLTWSIVPYSIFVLSSCRGSRLQSGRHRPTQLGDPRRRRRRDLRYRSHGASLPRRAGTELHRSRDAIRWLLWRPNERVQHWRHPDTKPRSYRPDSRADRGSVWRSWRSFLTQPNSAFSRSCLICIFRIHVKLQCIIDFILLYVLISQIESFGQGSRSDPKSTEAAQWTDILVASGYTVFVRYIEVSNSE